MKYRALGRTGLSVSEIGFGGWGIGGRTVGHTSYGETDDATSLAASRALSIAASPSSTRRVLMAKVTARR
jgi:aryl-alcohol dehydrogenase-like predicted oxidoreductase